MDGEAKIGNWRSVLLHAFAQDSRYALIENANSVLVFGCTYDPEIRIAFDLDSYGYVVDQRLTSMKINHPKSLGLNRYWDYDFQYFERGYFNEPPTFGNPGLLFNDRNVSSIFDDLKIGYRGTETHYFNDQTLLAIHLSVEEGCLAGIKSYDRWYFDWRPKGIVSQFKWMFASMEDASRIFFANATITKKEQIDLSEIFKGVSIGGSGQA